VVGLCAGDTVKLRHALPDASPTVLCDCELPSLPASATVNGPRDTGALTHACRVALLPTHATPQFAVHESWAPKPITHTCWWRHWPPGGFWSAVVQAACPGLVFHEIVVHVPGSH